MTDEKTVDIESDLLALEEGDGYSAILNTSTSPPSNKVYATTTTTPSPSTTSSSMNNHHHNGYTRRNSDHGSVLPSSPSLSYASSNIVQNNNNNNNNNNHHNHSNSMSKSTSSSSSSLSRRPYSRFFSAEYLLTGEQESGPILPTTSTTTSSTDPANSSQQLPYYNYSNSNSHNICTLPPLPPSRGSTPKVNLFIPPPPPLNAGYSDPSSPSPSLITTTTTNNAVSPPPPTMVNDFDTQQQSSGEYSLESVLTEAIIQPTSSPQAPKTPTTTSPSATVKPFAIPPPHILHPYTYPQASSPHMNPALSPLLSSPMHQAPHSPALSTVSSTHSSTGSGSTSPTRRTRIRFSHLNNLTKQQQESQSGVVRSDSKYSIGDEVLFEMVEKAITPVHEELAQESVVQEVMISSTMNHVEELVMTDENGEFQGFVNTSIPITIESLQPQPPFPQPQPQPKPPRQMDTNVNLPLPLPLDSRRRSVLLREYDPRLRRVASNDSLQSSYTNKSSGGRSFYSANSSNISTWSDATIPQDHGSQTSQSSSSSSDGSLTEDDDPETQLDQQDVYKSPKPLPFASPRPSRNFNTAVSNVMYPYPKLSHPVSASSSATTCSTKFEIANEYLEPLSLDIRDNMFERPLEPEPFTPDSSYNNPGSKSLDLSYLQTELDVIKQDVEGLKSTVQHIQQHLIVETVRIGGGVDERGLPEEELLISFEQVVGNQESEDSAGEMMNVYERGVQTSFSPYQFDYQHQQNQQPLFIPNSQQQQPQPQPDPPHGGRSFLHPHQPRKHYFPYNGEGDDDLVTASRVYNQYANHGRSRPSRQQQPPPPVLPPVEQLPSQNKAEAEDEDGVETFVFRVDDELLSQSSQQQHHFPQQRQPFPQIHSPRPYSNSIPFANPPHYQQDRMNHFEPPFLRNLRNTLLTELDIQAYLQSHRHGYAYQQQQHSAGLSPDELEWVAQMVRVQVGNLSGCIGLAERFVHDNGGPGERVGGLVGVEEDLVDLGSEGSREEVQVHQEEGVKEEQEEGEQQPSPPLQMESRDGHGWVFKAPAPPVISTSNQPSSVTSTWHVPSRQYQPSSRQYQPPPQQQQQQNWGVWGRMNPSFRPQSSTPRSTQSSASFRGGKIWKNVSRVVEQSGDVTPSSSSSPHLPNPEQRPQSWRNEWGEWKND